MTAFRLTCFASRHCFHLRAATKYDDVGSRFAFLIVTKYVAAYVMFSLKASNHIKDHYTRIFFNVKQPVLCYKLLGLQASFLVALDFWLASLATHD